MLQTLKNPSAVTLMYLQRPNGKHGKGGNLNYAFSASSAELVAVFDAGEFDLVNSLFCHLAPTSFMKLLGSASRATAHLSC